MDGCGAATPCYVWRGGSDRDSGCIGADGCVFDVVEGGGEEWLSVVWNGYSEEGEKGTHHTTIKSAVEKIEKSSERYIIP